LQMDDKARADASAAVAATKAEEATTASGISSRDSEDGMSPSNYRVRALHRVEEAVDKEVLEGCDTLSLLPVRQMSTQAIGSVDELLAKDAEDESLRRYKEQLLGSAAHGDRGGVCSFKQSCKSGC
jgi:hypothetical protein